MTLRTCLHPRPVRVPGRQSAIMAGVAYGPRALTRRSWGGFKPALRHIGWLARGVACASYALSNLPRGARLVGGGLMIEYEAPADGTAILIERASGRIVATESLSEVARFRFDPNVQGYDEVLCRMFADTVVVGGRRLRGGLDKHVPPALPCSP